MALTYSDFQQRINIQDVLTHAGYVQNRRDGLRYPSYIRMGEDGRRVRGDKFIVTANGLCCFQPPERRNYNVISFIKEHPNLFAEYSPGMSTDRLVNVVCNKILRQPIDERPSQSFKREREPQKPFDVDDYDLKGFDYEDFESQKPFYPYFKNRGICLDTQKAFSDCFCLVNRTSSDGKTYTNLGFPLTLASWPGKDIVGLEERGKPNAEGKSYKGMAPGSNAAEGMWIVCLHSHRSDLGRPPMREAKDVYWFESAFDAMAFYQIEKKRSPLAYHDLGNAVYVSTGGTPSAKPLKQMMENTPNAVHHLCFDRDQAGEEFCRMFHSLAPKGLTIHRMLPDEPYKDWNDQLMDKPMEQEQSKGMRR